MTHYNIFDQWGNASYNNSSEEEAKPPPDPLPTPPMYMVEVRYPSCCYICGVSMTNYPKEYIVQRCYGDSKTQFGMSFCYGCYQSHIIKSPITL